MKFFKNLFIAKWGDSKWKMHPTYGVSRYYSDHCVIQKFQIASEYPLLNVKKQADRLKDVIVNVKHRLMVLCTKVNSSK